ncbi:aminopeptidase N-like [Nylanderia fulva]|uniref:aminopeptidase N-like n=1 Tax=Nylanderia fulva TaxID=613905 RepID=UPI0010FAD66F|nr:aminopeptidase N-like [Nylanderia fulva]
MPVPNIEIDENHVLWTHFNTTPAISPYLITILLSNNLIHSDDKTRRINMWSRLESRLNIRHAENIAEDITLDFQRYWNRSNSFTHVTHAVIPNFHDKNIIVFGLVLYKEIDIIFNKFLYPVAREIQVVQFVGHKVAQQWFYNLNNPFQSTSWFNEGLTGLLATIAVHKIYPRYRIMNLFVVQNQHNSFSLDGDYHMWKSPLPDDSLFNIRKSIRAPFLLRMVQHAFTEELFWKSVRSYAFGNRLPWKQEWTYCKGLMITTINETTWESVFDIGVNKSDAKFLEYLACPEDIDVIIYYLKNKRYHSIKREYQLDVNSFLHIITKHAKNPTILKYILDHFNEVKPNINYYNQQRIFRQFISANIKEC